MLNSEVDLFTALLNMCAACRTTLGWSAVRAQEGRVTSVTECPTCASRLGTHFPPPDSRDANGNVLVRGSGIGRVETHPVTEALRRQLHEAREAEHSANVERARLAELDGGISGEQRRIQQARAADAQSDAGSTKDPSK